MSQRTFGEGWGGCLGILHLRGLRTTRRGAATYFTARAQLRAEAEHAWDRSLRDLRLPHYQRLFHLTRVMPREWLHSTVPCKVEVISIRESLRDWYFGEESGGMFLSQPARDW